MSRRLRTLSQDEKIMWHRVARSATPLDRRRAAALDDMLPPEPPPAAEAPKPARKEKTPAQAPFLPPYSPETRKQAAPETPAAIDDPTHARIARGKLDIEARIDLHGMTQFDAHGALLSFLHRAHASGLRHVLVITGKGMSRGGEGVLRRAVPGWLATPAFRGLVSAHATAARHHGGDGALYVRLRRTRP